MMSSANNLGMYDNDPIRKQVLDTLYKNGNFQARTGCSNWCIMINVDTDVTQIAAYNIKNAKVWLWNKNALEKNSHVHTWSAQPKGIDSIDKNMLERFIQTWTPQHYEPPRVTNAEVEQCLERVLALGGPQDYEPQTSLAIFAWILYMHTHKNARIIDQLIGTSKERTLESIREMYAAIQKEKISTLELPEAHHES